MNFVSIFAACLLLEVRPARADYPIRQPTLWLTGDSSMSKWGRNDNLTDGWGQFLWQYVSVPVINRSIGGRSARMFYTQGRFHNLSNEILAGDIVLIEFGHNDGGDPSFNDTGKPDCYGAGNETCISDKTGEVVHTFVWYVVEASRLMLAKGANVIISSQTPNNRWEHGYWNHTIPGFVDYARIAKDILNSPQVTFVDHFQAVVNMMWELGNASTNALFVSPDHTHTVPRGSDLVAEAFVQACYENMNGSTGLEDYIRTPVNIVY